MRDRDSGDQQMSSKKSWRIESEAIIARVIELLQRYECVQGITQEPYKGDFFKVFSNAYRAGFCTVRRRFDPTSGRMVVCKVQRPLVSRDAIWAAAKNLAWIHGEMDPSEKRYCDIKLVCSWWNEWTYAWDRNPPPRKSSRSNRSAELASKPANEA
jgi:hypothetical protein